MMIVRYHLRTLTLLLLYCTLVVVVVSTLAATADTGVNFDPNETNFYRMLNIEQSADNREIRKAFKKLALTLHPDKNTGDPAAHENFLRLNRAYEVLKDEKLRQIYDQFGEKGLNENVGGSGGRGSYQTWNYYYESFGIYDNDEEIVTLNWADFDQSIRNTAHDFIWFVNFYSGRCSHCHHLAPEWRRMAKQLSTVIRIGAVNCEDDRSLCQQEGIRSYPSLVLYPFGRHFDGTERTAEQLTQFVLRNLNVKLHRYNDVNMYRLLQRINATSSSNSRSKESFSKWYLAVVCFEQHDDNRNKNCLPQETIKMLAYKLNNIVQVIELACTTKEAKVCEHFGLHQSKVVLFPDIGTNARKYYEIMNFNDNNDDDDNDDGAAIDPSLVEPKQLFNRIMEKFPPLDHITSEEKQWLSEVLFESSSSTTKNIDIKHFNQLLSSSSGCILLFCSGKKCADDFVIELKFLQQFIPQHRIVIVTEESSGEFARKFNIKKYPSLVTIKVIDNNNNDDDHHKRTPPIITYEPYHGGRWNAIDLFNFVHDSLQSQLKTLSSAEFEEKIVGEKNSEKISVIQFFAPWCPACKTAQQKLRKISSHKFDIDDDDNTNKKHSITFGVIDCAIYSNLCRQYNIHSYPTVLLYYRTIPYQYYGNYKEDQELIDFIHYTIQSKVIELDPDMFVSLVANRAGGGDGNDDGNDGQHQVWAVDFYSPYCQPCQTLAPTWRKLSVIMSQNDGIKQLRLAQLNCIRWRSFCTELQIQSYPTIRVYPAKVDRKHQHSFYKYQEQQRNVYLLRAWLYDFLPTYQLDEIQSGNEFEQRILASSQPTLVNFYIPWAFSSRRYGPDFSRLSKNVTEIKFFNLNCHHLSSICERASVEYFPTIRFYGGGGGSNRNEHIRHVWHGVHIQAFPGASQEQMTNLLRSLVSQQQSTSTMIKDEL